MQTTAIADAGAPERGVSNTAKRKRKRRGLDAFVGNWTMEGEQYGKVFSLPARVSAEESFEWLPGRKFLIHRVTGQLGGSDLVSIEVIDADPTPGGYRVHTFYGDGRAQDWLLVENDDNWTISADWSLADGSIRGMRCTVRFESDETRSAKWEVSNYGTWKTFWVITSEKKHR